MKNRCYLCGGTLSGGRCRECGLDNTKNDQKYHLNRHSQEQQDFHTGSCDEGLNKKRKQSAWEVQREAQEKKRQEDYKRKKAGNAPGTTQTQLDPKGRKNSTGTKKSKRIGLWIFWIYVLFIILRQLISS